MLLKMAYNDPQLMAGGISKDNISRLTLGAVRWCGQPVKWTLFNF